MCKRMYRITISLIEIICLSAILSNEFLATTAQLSEGDSCSLTSGNEGVCTVHQNCEFWKRKMQNREFPRGSDVCGYKHIDPIVCCPNQNPVQEVRQAERACREYQNFADGKEHGQIDISADIIGGETAQPGDFPFMVALAYRNDPNNPLNISYICGGSLISNRHVLTAAHCASNVNEYVPFEVRIGSTRLNRDDPDTQNIPINNIEVHPMYRRSANYYDIAVITLSRPVTFVVNKTMPICLQTVPLNSIQNLVERHFIVSGWGVTDYDGNTSNDLRYTRNLTLIDKETCANQYKELRKLPRGVDDSLLCILDTNPNSRSDACQGDSGGPLFLRQMGVSTVVGVVSFGQSCASAIASIYSSVFYHLDWIEKQVWTNDYIPWAR